MVEEEEEEVELERDDEDAGEGEDTTQCKPPSLSQRPLSDMPCLILQCSGRFPAWDQV